MIHATCRATPRLTRATLLPSALNALDRARAVEAHAHGDLAERLAAHREVLARRAANVALAPDVSAEELRDLRDAARRLVALAGHAARKLGSRPRMS